MLLKPEQALALALVFHELTTNAIKYGALSAIGGHLDVSWNITPEDGVPGSGKQLTVSWTERCGSPISAERTRGFGSDLIERSLGHGLGGTVEREFRPAGVVVRITLPLG